MQYIPKWLVQTIAGLLSVLLLVMVIAKALEIKNVSRTVGDGHTISISAEGKVTSTPDMAMINTSVVVDGDTASKAQSDANKKSESIISFLKSKGIPAEDIKTAAYNTYPKYNYINGVSNIIGYTANQSLNIKVHKLDLVGTLLDGITQNGANQIDSVNYDFNDPDGFKEQAREMALANAKTKAQNLANAAGVSLGKLVSFSENVSGDGPIPMFDKGLGMGGGGSSAAIQPGTQDIVAQVNVVYQIK
jgi:uncharacterized protein YggE